MLSHRSLIRMPKKLGMHAKPFLSESAWSQCPKRLGMHAKPNCCFGGGFRVSPASIACQAWKRMPVMTFICFTREYILSTHPLSLRLRCLGPGWFFGSDLAVPGCAKLLLLLLAAAAGRGWLVLAASRLLPAVGCCWQLRPLLICAGCCWVQLTAN